MAELSIKDLTILSSPNFDPLGVPAPEYRDGFGGVRGAKVANAFPVTSPGPPRWTPHGVGEQVSHQDR